MTDIDPRLTAICRLYAESIKADRKELDALNEQRKELKQSIADNIQKLIELNMPTPLLDAIDN
jgi:hypothetical protein